MPNITTNNAITYTNTEDRTFGIGICRAILHKGPQTNFMIISIFIKFHTRNTFFRENNLQCNNLLKSCQKRGKIKVSVNSSAWPLNKHLSHKSS